MSFTEVSPGRRTFLALRQCAAAADGGARQLRAFHSFAQVCRRIGGVCTSTPAPLPQQAARAAAAPAAAAAPQHWPDDSFRPPCKQVLEELGGRRDQMPLGADLRPSCKDDADTSPDQHARDGLWRMQLFMLSIGLQYDYGWQARAARYGDSSGSGSDGGDGGDADAGQGAAADARPARKPFIQLQFRHQALTRNHTVYGMQPAIWLACLRS